LNTTRAARTAEPVAEQAGLLSQLQPALEDVCAARGGFGSVAPMGVPRKVTDSSDKYLVRDRGGRPLAVLSVSPPDRPHATDQAADRTREAQSALGQRLGRAVLMPWHVATVKGLSYSLTPYRRPLSTFGPRRAIERRRLMPPAWRWLLEALRHTVRAPDVQELDANFLIPLRALANLGTVSSAIRQRAARELSALEAGQWQARLTLAHYDLWEGNFLWAPGDCEFGFAIIDWGGARAGGHAIYDLLRLAISSPAAHDATLAQLRDHCRTLECAPEHAAGHALAALGYLTMNLGDWPVDRFAITAQSCFDLLMVLEQRYRERRLVPAQALRTYAWGLSEPAFAALQRLDLADYDALMHADLGGPFKTKPGLAMHRLRVPQTGQVLFLKRCTEATSESLWRLAARRWLRRRPLHSEPYHVYLAAQALQAQGFNAMPVVAWGERRWLGWLPDQGFVVASAVPGDSLDGVFATGSALVRRRLLHVVGLLMGRLHRCGFCVTLRLHDLFVPAQEFEGQAWNSIEPALIDLDFNGHLLQATGFEQERAIRATAHSAYLLLRTGLRFDPGEAAAWLRGYRGQLRDAGIALPRCLAERLRRRLQFELSQHHKDQRLVAMFPATPLPAAAASPVRQRR
jgi:thiamine kinase-like enzyme